MRSAGRTRFQLTPDSVRGEMMRRYAPQCGAAVDAVPESVGGDASAAHQRRADVPRRCRGLTEDVTTRAVMLRLWSSSVPPKRRAMVDRLCPMRPPLSRRANGVMMQ